MTIKTVAEIVKSPCWSPWKGLITIPWRFLTGSSSATGVVIGGAGPATNVSQCTVTWQSSTVYVINVPGIRFAKSAQGTGSSQNFLPWCYSTPTTGNAQFISSTTYAAGPNGTTNITLTFSGAPPNGTEVRGFILGQAINVK